MADSNNASNNKYLIGINNSNSSRYNAPKPSKPPVDESAKDLLELLEGKQTALRSAIASTQTLLRGDYYQTRRDHLQARIESLQCELAQLDSEYENADAIIEQARDELEVISERIKVLRNAASIDKLFQLAEKLQHGNH